MRMIIDGKIGCLASAVEMLSPRSISPAAVRTAFSMITLPTVLDTMPNTSRIGTPLRMRDANVRVKRARQILCAITPNIGIRSRVRSQNSRPVFVLI